jgi:transcriptional regulator with XRE-family HTH domain
MDLKQIFIINLKNFRKNEGISQMKLAERCNTSPSYIGEIEIGKKFPSVEMIDKIAQALRIEPYHLFVNRINKTDVSLQDIYPKLPKSMKEDIISQVHTSLTAILDDY